MMKNKVEVNFNGEVLEVKKISVRKIGALAATLNNLPEALTDLFVQGNEAGELDTSSLLEKAPQLIISAADTLPPFLAVASDVDLEKILDGGIDDLIALIQGVLEVNNFETIVGYLKTS